jgi:hypothetical protein
VTGIERLALLLSGELSQVCFAAGWGTASGKTSTIDPSAIAPASAEG